LQSGGDINKIGRYWLMDRIDCWLQNSLTRVFPGTATNGSKGISIAAARNQRVSFQACVRNRGDIAISVRADVLAPEGLGVLVRRVGYVPVPHFNTETEEAELDGAGHIPGLVPDPLFPESETRLGPCETQSFWISVDVPAGTAPGTYQLEVELKGGPALEEERSAIGSLHASLDVAEWVAHPREGFPVTHWFYADALCDWYKVEPFDEGFWKIVQPYMADMVSHGNNCIYVPIFTPPTDGVKRPTQLLGVSATPDGAYTFSFDNVKRWVDTAKRYGARYFEWTHLFSQWGIEHAIRVYRDNADPTSLLWPEDTGATSDTYRNFLAQFLPAFHRFLEDEGLIDISFFHLSDEPHGDEHLKNYRKARALLKELAPWMKVMDALSDICYGKEGLTDIPVPSIRTAHEYTEAGIPSWAYFCCGPRGPYLNRLVDTPLAKIGMSGWLFYTLGAQGFLHWGYNYWYRRQSLQLIDPFTELAAGVWPEWPYGDTFVVYPGPDGPIDSIRWEVFAQSLQDYALLEQLGIPPESGLLSQIKGYADFPKSAEWIESMRRILLFGGCCC
jgi:hypothetical protein